MNEDFKREFELYEVESNFNKRVKYVVIGFLAFVTVCAGVIFGFSGLGSDESLSNSVAGAPMNYSSDISGIVVSETPPQNKVTAETRMIYEYFFPELNFTDFVEAPPPPSLIGLTESGLIALMTDWEIIKFSPREVVARKTVFPESSMTYILTTKDGFLAVYYEDAIHGGILKEITSIPVAGLSEDEIDRLERGILIHGIENLMRAMQDYGS